MEEQDEKELIEFLVERRKRKAFFEIIRRKYITIPSFILFIILTQDPNLNLIKLTRVAMSHLKKAF